MLERQNLRAYRVIEPSRRDALANGFLADNPIEVVNQDAYKAWRRRLIRDHLVPKALYAVEEVLLGGKKPPMRAAAVAKVDRANRTVELKALAIDKKLSNQRDRDLCIQMLIREVERDHRKEGFETIKVRANTKNHTSEYFGQQGWPSHAVPTDTGYRELIFELQIARYCTSDPLNALDWYLWFVEKELGLTAKRLRYRGGQWFAGDAVLIETLDGESPLLKGRARIEGLFSPKAMTPAEIAALCFVNPYHLLLMFLPQQIPEAPGRMVFSSDQVREPKRSIWRTKRGMVFQST